MKVILGRIFCFRKIWPNHDKITKTYEISYNRLNDEMNIVFIIKLLREVKILLEHFRKDPEINLKIFSDNQMFIELDEIEKPVFI